MVWSSEALRIQGYSCRFKKKIKSNPKPGDSRTKIPQKVYPKRSLLKRSYFDIHPTRLAILYWQKNDRVSKIHNNCHSLINYILLHWSAVVRSWWKCNGNISDVDPSVRKNATSEYNAKGLFGIVHRRIIYRYCLSSISKSSVSHLFRQFIILSASGRRGLSAKNLQYSPLIRTTDRETFAYKNQNRLLATKPRQCSQLIRITKRKIIHSKEWNGQNSCWSLQVDYTSEISVEHHDTVALKFQRKKGLYSHDGKRSCGCSPDDRVTWTNTASVCSSILWFCNRRRRRRKEAAGYGNKCREQVLRDDQYLSTFRNEIQ